MPQDLPGFYYDHEKNRYFPIKGPIPGSSSCHSRRTSSSSSSWKPEQAIIDQRDTHRRKRIRTTELLQARELYGRAPNSNQWKCDFKGEFHKIQASHPVIWKYHGMNGAADSGLEQFEVDIQTAEGQNRASVLLMGSMRGSLSLCEVGEIGQHFYEGFRYSPDCVWPSVKECQMQRIKAPSGIWKPRAPLLMPSNISCIKRIKKHTPQVVLGGSALISTLGSETSGGSVYVMKLDEPLDYNSGRRIFDIASLNCTIWTTDCSPNGVQAVIGTNLGVTSANLETGDLSWLCCSKSDVFAQQFDHSGNLILCGFRNGAIVTFDIRQRQQQLASRLPKHQLHQSPQTHNKLSNKKAPNFAKRYFEIRGNIVPSCTTCMPSSISSLVSLQMYDQYFLASSMDGSIKLYDHRLIQKGAIQSYEGHVNSHTRIQLGVDSAERLVASGGEDGKLRIWSIKTGELLFAEKISNSVPTRVCWPGIGGPRMVNHEECVFEQDPSWGAWLGSGEELFYMQL